MSPSGAIVSKQRKRGPRCRVKGLVFRFGLAHPKLVRRSSSHRFLITEKSDGFVRVSLIVQNYVVRPSLRTGAAARVNVDGSIRGCMTGALAIFAKCHFVAPVQS